jgi:uncharacterized protein YkwD
MRFRTSLAALAAASVAVAVPATAAAGGFLGGWFWQPPAPPTLPSWTIPAPPTTTTSTTTTSSPTTTTTPTPTTTSQTTTTAPSTTTVRTTTNAPTTTSAPAPAPTTTTKAPAPTTTTSRPTTTTPATTTTPSSSGLTSAEQALASAVNAARAQNGLPALTIDSRLEQAARDHTQELLQDNLFTHDFLRNGTSYPFATWIGWYYSGCAEGENIAWAQPSLSADQAVQMWLNSPEHRANMLSSNYTVMGVELAGLNGKFIATNDFGRPC